MKTIMKTILATLVIGFVLFAFSSPVFSQGRFPLKPTELDEADQRAMWMMQNYMSMSLDKPEQLKQPPKDISENVSYLVAPVGPEEILLLFDGGSVPKKFYVDSDRDGDLSDEKPFEGENGRSGLVFKNVLIGAAQKEKSAAKVNIQVWSRSGRAAYIAITPSECYAGNVKLGDTTHEVAFIDADFDGRCGSVFVPPFARGRQAFDFMAFDKNANGTFDVLNPMREVFPLPRMLNVGETYYSLKLEPDGSAVTIEKAKPEFGTLEVGSADMEVVLYSDAGMYQLFGSEKYTIPPGKYQLMALLLKGTDEEGHKWELQSSRGFSAFDNFEIVTGEKSRMEAGPPLTVATDVRKSGNSVRLSVSVKGRMGEEYPAGATKNDGRQSAPDFKILDESGKTLVTGSFRYG